MVSDAEDARLGLVIRESEGQAADLAGGSTGVRTALAQRIIIGRAQVEDVPFLVMRADQMPWKEPPPGEQGILGLLSRSTLFDGLAPGCATLEQRRYTAHRVLALRISDISVCT